MTLLLPRDRRRSRYVFDWSARSCLERNTLNPITGQTATFTRASIGTAIGSDGSVIPMAHSQPRFLWADLDADGVNETAAILLEAASTNLMLRSDELANAAWTTVIGATATNASKTTAGLAFSKLTQDGTANRAEASQDFTMGSNAAKAFSVFVRWDGLASGTFHIRAFDLTSSADVLSVPCTIAADGTITSGGASTGTLLRILALADKVYRIECQTAAVTSGHSIRFYAFINKGGGSPDTLLGPSTSQSVYVAGAQFEDALYPSSRIQTAAAAVTRGNEDLHFTWNVATQALTFYVKMIELERLASATDLRVIHVGASAADTFRITDSSGTSGGRYNAVHSTVTSGLASATPAFGDTVELRGILNADGSVQLGQSINGAAETVTTASAALPFVGWSGTTLYFNSSAGANFGQRAIIAVRVAPGVQSLAYLREG